MKHLVLFLVSLAFPVTAYGQAVPVPQKHIPPSVLTELRVLEGQFDLALVRDCASERCVSKGCVYRDHAVVDLPRSSSLPGIDQDEGLGSVPTQEYLTDARCDFAHEKSIAARDVQALVRRLEQRLSKGWMRVTVGRQILEPISASLSESPPSKPDPVSQPRVDPTAKPEPPATWEPGIAGRELWLSLLPHFSWMIALFLVTLAALVLIWALRRLGRDTLADKALMAQLAAGSLQKDVPEGTPAAGAATAPPASADDAAYVADQQRLWADRIAQAEIAKDESLVVEVLRQWLQAGEFALLAKAIFVFGDRLALAFSTDGELAVRKVQFAEYLRTLDERLLPPDAEFFRQLNHHAISSSMLSQADAETYRSIREEFGSVGVATLIKSLPPRPGALIFALVQSDFQHEVARALSPQLRLQAAAQLLLSNRISKEEQGHVFDVLDAARAGLPLPAAPTPVTDGIADRGRVFDAAGALSVLFSYLEPSDRRALLSATLERSGGTLALWYQDILYPDMLAKLPPELLADMLLQVDVRGLAGYCSVQSAAWQARFTDALAPTMQSALRANQAFGSRDEQLRMARLGHAELAAALNALVAAGKISFMEIVA